MKTCPVCSAIAFDDQMTCYGCLHAFEEAPASETQAVTPAGLPEDNVSQSFLFGALHADEGPFGRSEHGKVASHAKAARFIVSFSPRIGGGDAVAWDCSIEPMEEVVLGGGNKEAASQAVVSR